MKELPPPVRLHAHAKLTLSLRVRGRRDDGFHEVDGLVAALADLHDRVDVTLLPGTEVTFLLAGRRRGVPAGADNLAVVAAHRLREHFRVDNGVGIRLQKAIPPGSGLGGGSADAAAVLEGLARLTGKPGGRALVAVAAAVGSDVPVCLLGGLARMRGRGEDVEPLPAVGGWGVVVAVPPFPVATADVYRAWDDLGGPAADRSVPAPGPLRPLAAELVNDLEPAALAVEPRLAAFRAAVESAAGRLALLAGSGSAYVVPVEGDAAADLAAAVREGVPDALVLASRPSPRGVTFVAS